MTTRKYAADFADDGCVGCAAFAPITKGFDWAQIRP
jgi:hypothetical protein